MGGITNWRLPTRTELVRTVVCDNGKPPLETGNWSCNDPFEDATGVKKINQAFSCSPNAFIYWTSTEWQFGMFPAAYTIDYYYGWAANASAKDTTWSTRCVAPTPPNPGVNLLLNNDKNK
mgnify:CR=1 FL=1